VRVEFILVGTVGDQILLSSNKRQKKKKKSYNVTFWIFILDSVTQR